MADVEFTIRARDNAARALQRIGRESSKVRRRRSRADVSLALLVVAVIGIVLLLFRVHFGG